jgi:hypothetical protein
VYFTSLARRPGNARDHAIVEDREPPAEKLFLEGHAFELRRNGEGERNRNGVLRGRLAHVARLRGVLDQQRLRDFQQPRLGPDRDVHLLQHQRTGLRHRVANRQLHAGGRLKFREANARAGIEYAVPVCADQIEIVIAQRQSRDAESAIFVRNGFTKRHELPFELHLHHDLGLARDRRAAGHVDDRAFDGAALRNRDGEGNERAEEEERELHEGQVLVHLSDISDLKSEI